VGDGGICGESLLSKAVPAEHTKPAEKADPACVTANKSVIIREIRGFNHFRS